jgi:hypothetical protein
LKFGEGMNSNKRLQKLYYQIEPENIITIEKLIESHKLLNEWVIFFAET